MTKKLAKKRTDPREKEIDLESLRNLRQIAVTEDEAAAVFGVSRRTIIRRLKRPEYRQAWDDGLALCKVGLKRQMIRHSKMANSAGVHASKFLMEHINGWTEKRALELAMKDGQSLASVNISTLSNAQLDILIERISAAVGLAGGVVGSEGGEDAEAQLH